VAQSSAWAAAAEPVAAAAGPVAAVGSPRRGLVRGGAPLAAAAPAAAASSPAALHPRLTVLDSRAVTALLTIIRDARTRHADFAAAADRLMT
jgi:hypothetical protein